MDHRNNWPAGKERFCNIFWKEKRRKKLLSFCLSALLQCTITGPTLRINWESDKIQIYLNMASDMGTFIPMTKSGFIMLSGKSYQW